MDSCVSQCTKLCQNTAGHKSTQPTRSRVQTRSLTKSAVKQVCLVTANCKCGENTGVGHAEPQSTYETLDHRQTASRHTHRQWLLDPEEVFTQSTFMKSKSVSQHPLIKCMENAVTWPLKIYPTKMEKYSKEKLHLNQMCTLGPYFLLQHGVHAASTLGVRYVSNLEGT